MTRFLYFFLWDPALDLASTLRLHRYFHLLGQHHILPLDLLQSLDQELILVLRLMKSLLDGLDLVVSLLDDLAFSKLCGFFIFEALLCLGDIRADLFELFVLFAGHLLEGAPGLFLLFQALSHMQEVIH